MDISSNPVSKIRLLQAAEKAKIRLSTEAVAEINEEFIIQKEGVGLHLHYKITRAEFEEMIRPIIKRTLNSVNTAFSQANCKAQDLSRVILVGGSTQIPLVSEILKEELKIAPQIWMNPATVVAQGAAIAAANIAGEQIGSIMVDIMSHSLGTGIMENNGSLENFILINRNTPLPATASQIFYKCWDDTDEITVTAYQGESRKTELCRLLGEFKLEGLSSDAKSEILIKFEMDRNGLLNVSATEVGSGKSSNKVMRRIKSSEIGKKNLADLDTIRINTEEESSIEEEEFSDERQWINPLTQEIDEEASSSLLSKELEDRVQALLCKPHISDEDKRELEHNLVALKSGETAASERLTNILYFME